MIIGIRKATADDAKLIAEGVFRAFLLGENHPRREEWMRVLTCVCAQPDTQYSYTNTVVATDEEGRDIGIMIVIDGNDYARQRRNMFDQLSDLFSEVFGPGWEEMEDEAAPGELYIDSLAVLPPYRRQGVGTALLQYAIREARRLQLTATLAVEPANPAKRLYARLGFAYRSDIVIFNEAYELWGRVRHLGRAD